MAKRDSKGRFIRGKRGMGTIITMRKGMGALPGGKLGEAVIPPLVGGFTTVLAALAVRHFVDPAAGETQRMMVRWAWLIGHATGIAASLVLLLVGGTPAAISSSVAATAVGLGFFGQDMLLQRNAGSTVAALTDTSATAPGTAGYRRRLGAGAIVPEYSGTRGLGAMAMEPVGPGGKRAGTLGAAPYGQVVSLGGISSGAFGTKPFHA